ncbi:MAG: hypothetical protein FJ303_26290 [Planctomycetes bacterium]|nr:hypothetical protein [Planctomycetota bacterium]
MVNTRCIVWLLSFSCLPIFAISGTASEYCCGSVKDLPLAQQMDEAAIVLFGRFENAKVNPNGIDPGTTDFIIEKRYKDHPMIKGKDRIVVPRHIPNNKNKFIVFVDIFNGKLDPYKGTELVNDTEMVRYIDKVMALKGRPQSERLRNAFDFLQSPEIEVSMDAYREFARSDYGDYKEMAKKLPADTLAGWLRDKKTPAYRFGLYATLLGHCGNGKHAEMMLEMINDSEKRKSSGAHGFMMAYAMLEPVKGWTFIKNLIADKDEPFLLRYSGLQTIRFLYEVRTDVVAKDETIARKEIIAGVRRVLKVIDMCDFAIEDLRKWKRWECSDEVLGLFNNKDYSRRIIQKSIVRYAIQCDTDAARRFVKVQRSLDKEWVDEVEELLNLETAPPAVTPKTK